MVPYEFYANTYLGVNIPVEEWNGYAMRAGQQLKRYKRIFTVVVPEDEPEAESKAVCAMAEAMYSFDLIANGEGGAVQSVSIGSVSTSWGGSGTNAVDISPAGQARELYRCACLHLDIYRGVG